MKAKNTLGLILFPAFDWAISRSHPEREERLLYTQDQLLEEGIEDIEGIEFFNPGMATLHDINRVHFCFPDAQSLLTESHLIAAGGVMRAFDAVLSGETDKAFALVRPPGHHAQRVVYGDRGFCIINIEAVGLEYARQRYGDMRVAIVDTDCHHGDGTEDIYWNDPDTLFISFHQDGRTLYPGTGDIDELGGPGAFGYNVNIPLPPNTGDAGFHYILENTVMPILEDYKPDIIINSAGQDNHYTDPLTNMNFSAQGYAALNERLNPDIAVLEGGYSIQGALPYVNTGIILAMAGLDYSGVVEPDYHLGKWRQSERVTDHVRRIAEQVNERWLKREELSKREYGDRLTVTRRRQVYYDTAGIMEIQVQEFKVCSECPGVNTVHSYNDRGASMAGITIPRKACHACREEGYKLFEHAAATKKSYLQDMSSDDYMVSR
ncbi:MAG: histone deacetylase [Clostridiaceae bacterium]|jgi:acetoin utilization deacetylase AcuC-like enzyme|nr:histone deacetylase [Clostridia bacterium]MBP6161510.1 histone deacetylase [Clostridia bacterium]MBP6949710.1 histone deacetylase [Clostridia bacterium]NMA35712.1 histone deacetylase [Clostridiaceae bacterium]